MKICALLPISPRHASRMAKKRTNIKNYFGLNIIRDVITRELSIEVPIITYEQVNEFDVVLFSCLSIEDYYSFVYTYERKLRGRTNAIFIAGGPSVSNVNPFIPYFDYVVVGRAETIITPLLQAIKSGTIYSHPAVVYSKNYKESDLVFTEYATQLYPHEVDGIRETMYGCKYNCTYCRYRSATLPPTKREFAKTTTMPGNEETFWDLEITNGKFHTTSFDALTQAVRFAVLKPIKNKSIVEAFVKWSKKTNKINIKVYQIIGYPYNYDLDFTELKEVFTQISNQVNNCDIFVSIHFTPFGADPQTPMQWEKVSVDTNFREKIESLRAQEPFFFESENVRVMFMRTTMHPYSLLRRMVFQRASLADQEIINYLANDPEQTTRHRYFDEKLAMAFSKFDLEKFVKAYPIGAPLPSQNIIVWKTQRQMIKEGELTRRRLKLAAKKNSC